MNWKKQLTRNYNLIEATYSQLAYPRIPDFNIKNVIIVGNGDVIERYLDETELSNFYKHILAAKDLKQRFQKALELDAELVQLIKKPPLEVFPVFHEKFIEWWSYSLLAYWTGQTMNEQQITPFKHEIEFIRGSKAVKNQIEGVFLKQLLKDLAAKTKISPELIGYAFAEEILANKFDFQQLKKRREHYCWVIKNKKSEFFIGSEAREVEKRELGQNYVNLAIVKELTGQTACPGIVTGIARVLQRVDECSKVKQGEILVAPMVNPNYSIAMEKAAAFVTDEGGVTCHAVIVSREMNKPCIVGTKIATKIIKDGDEIEVNATTGVVKIIKRK